MGLLRSGLRLGAILVLLASLLLPFSIPLIRFMGLEWWLRPAVAAPLSLEEAMAREPTRRLTAAEVDTLKREGVLLLRSVLTTEVTTELRRLAWKHTMMPFIETRLNQKHWLWNGGVRSLVKDSPAGELLASSLEFEETPSRTLRINEAPIWSWPATKRVIRNSWHTDSRTHQEGFMTFWIVLTNGSKPFEFIRRSHLQRDLIERDCAHLVRGGKNGFKEYDRACVDKHISRLDKEREEGSAVFGEDLGVGDAYLFGGSMLHAGIRQDYERIAISMRASIAPKFPKCAWDFPGLLPRSNDHDFQCAPWLLLPGLVFSPFIPASLGWVLRYLPFQS